LITQVDLTKAKTAYIEKLTKSVTLDEHERICAEDDDEQDIIQVGSHIMPTTHTNN
jgi:hypothetical protein